MIKKLDKLVLKAFIGPFTATFFITLFVLMMQIIWKYIDDLVGKGLDFFTLIKFVIYASATLITLALPIAILLSSIMTFGKLGENFELVALRSSGISLLRFMRPLFFVSIIFCFITFLFANYVIPVARLKFAVIYNDIVHKSPAFNLKEGIFYNDFKGYSIKVSKKEKDKSTLHNILIYEQTAGPQDNSIVAEKGFMRTSTDKKFLELKLQNGTRYEEKGSVTSLDNEFIRLNFKEYDKLFDLRQLEMQLSPDSLFKNNFSMQTLRQLDITLNNINSKPDSFSKRMQFEMTAYFDYFKYRDSGYNYPAPIKGVPAKFDMLVPDTLKYTINDNALTVINNARNLAAVTAGDYDFQSKNVKSILVEWHRKFAMSAACLVLLLIGAPLGSIIRKGGIGLPILVALIFFTVFHLLNTFGDKLVVSDLLRPMTGMWLSVIVLLPVGLFFTYKATRDSHFFNKEYYYRIARRIRRIFNPDFGVNKKENISVT